MYCPGKSTSSYAIPRSFWYSVAFCVVFFALFATWILLKENSSLAFARQMGIGLTLSLFIGFIISTIGIPAASSWSRSVTRHLLRQLFHPLSICLFLQFLADMTYTFQYWDQVGVVYPTSADALSLASDVALLWGLLRLPMRSLVRTDRTRLLLDSLILIVTVITFSWYFTLGPTILSAVNKSPLAAAVSIAFPSGDLLLLSCTILFTTFLFAGKGCAPLYLLSSALLAFAFSDSAYTYRMLQRAYTPGWPDLGWVLAMLLLALATQMLRRLPAQAPYRGPSLDEAPSLAAAPLWVLLLPYILVPSVFVLIIYVWHTRADGPLVVGTYCSGLLLLLFIFLRQLFSLQETRRLNHRLHLAQQALREKQEALHTQNAALEQANTRLGMLATTDPLTELPNHRALLTSLTHEQECAQRNQRSYAVLFLDLDHFKELNDGYGHTAGDVALFEFAQLLGRSMRTTDTVGRWGGEEFVAVLPETEASDALAIAQHLRTTVNQQPFAVGSGLYLTCTIGLACYPAHGETLDAIINAADQAMYAAKRLGRNQVRPIDDPAVQFVLTHGNCEGSREETTLLGFIEAFCSLLEERDPLLAEHSRAVACLVQQLAMSMGVSGQEAQMMSLAGQLHDLGKISLPDAILQKPVPLTSEEWQQMKRHVCVGADMLAHIPSLHSLAPIVRAHHERWNGTGYPDHLKGEEIPFAARLIGVADSYLAMTMDGPYQKALPSEVALGELQHCAGSLFDPIIVWALGELLVKQPFFPQTAEAATAERAMYSH